MNPARPRPIYKKKIENEEKEGTDGSTDQLTSSPATRMCSWMGVVMAMTFSCGKPSACRQICPLGDRPEPAPLLVVGVCVNA
jgi:hypothetical protein